MKKLKQTHRPQNGEKFRHKKSGKIVTIENVYCKAVYGENKGKFGIAYYYREGHLLWQLYVEFAEDFERIK